MSRLDWFEVSGQLQFFPGAPMNIVGVGEGYERALDHARSAIERPHSTVERDLLTAECNEIGELLFQIVLEDTHSLSLGAAIRALVLETARREDIAAGRP